jgi:hypothetical protein
VTRAELGGGTAVPRPSICAHCGAPRKRRPGGGWRGAHNWCATCTKLWYRHGKPEGGPARISGEERARRISAGLRRWHATHQQSPAARAALAAENTRRRNDRLTDYAWLRSFGEDWRSAAHRAGVSEGTARWVYEPLIAAMEDEPAAGWRAA